MHFVQGNECTLEAHVSTLYHEKNLIINVIFDEQLNADNVVER